MSITLNTKIYSFTGFNQNGQSVYKETSGGIPSSFSYLTDKVNTGTGKSDSTVKWNLSIPVTVTEDSSCACTGDVLRTNYVKVDVSIGAGSPLSERTDLWTRLRDLIASPEFKASVENLVQASS